MADNSGLHAALLPAMFFREGEEVSNPDKDAGLYIRDRRGEHSKVVIPPTALAFQMGEASQVQHMPICLQAGILGCCCSVTESRGLRELGSHVGCHKQVCIFKLHTLTSKAHH